MLLSSIDLTKEKPEKIRCFFYDPDSLQFFGPVSFLGHRLLISQPANIFYLKDFIKELMSEYKNIKAVIKPFNYKKSILHVYCDPHTAEELVLKKKGKLFRTKPKDIAYYKNDFLISDFIFPENIINALHLQKKLNAKIREFYYTTLHRKIGIKKYLTEKMNIDDFNDLESILQEKKTSRLKETEIILLKDISNLFIKLKGAVSQTKDKAHIDFENVRADILLLNNSSYQKREISDIELDLEKIMVANDTEIGDYLSNNPQMYLSCYVFKEGGVSIGVSEISNFDENYIGDRKFVYINAKNSDNIRKISGDFLFCAKNFGVSREFLFEIGFNNCGFDQQKFYNPRRNNIEKILDDGIFRPAPDNSGVKYEAKSAGNERFSHHGSILLDMYLFAKTNFNSFLPDMSLVSVLNLLNRFSEKNIQYEKIFTTYRETEQLYQEWLKGDIEAGRKLVQYCQEDTIAHYNIGTFFIDVIFNLSRILKLHPYNICNLNIKKTAQQFWDKKTFRKINYVRNQKLSNIKNPKYEIKNPNDLSDILSDTDVYEFFKRKKTKLRLLEYAKKYDLEIQKQNGLIKNLECYYASFLSKLIIDHIDGKELRQLEEIIQKEKNVIKKLCYSNFLEALIAEFLVDFKKAVVEKNPSIIFAKYHPKEKNFIEKFIESVENKLEKIANLLKDKLFFSNGEIVYTKPLQDEAKKELENLGFLYLSKADVIKIDEESAISDLGDLIFAIGIGVPSKKKRYYTAPEDISDPLIDIKIQYDFIKEIFKDKENATKIILDYIENIENNKIPAKDYIKTIKLTKHIDQYINQESKTIIAARMLGLQNAGDIGFFGIGKLGEEQGFIKYTETTKNHFENSFIPDKKKYYEKIFDENRSLAKIFKAVYNEKITDFLKNQGIEI